MGIQRNRETWCCISGIRSCYTCTEGPSSFGIYGHDVQEADDTSIPEDVKEKLLRFGRAAVAAASMRGKSYLQIGSVTMGIGGSIIDSDFIESYLGMRVESVDEVEIIRRMTEVSTITKSLRKLSMGKRDLQDRLGQEPGRASVLTREERGAVRVCC